MRSEAPTSGTGDFLTGFVGGLPATVLVLVVADLAPSERSSMTLLVGAGLMLLVGILLMFPGRTWLAGFGFLVGAAISLAVAILIRGILIAQRTV